MALPSCVGNGNGYMRDAIDGPSLTPIALEAAAWTVASHFGHNPYVPIKSSDGQNLILEWAHEGYCRGSDRETGYARRR